MKHIAMLVYPGLTALEIPCSPDAAGQLVRKAR